MQVYKIHNSDSFNGVTIPLGSALTFITHSGDSYKMQLKTASGVTPISSDLTDPVYTADKPYIALKSLIPENSDFTLSGLSLKSYNNLTDRPTIPTALSSLTDDATHRLVTDSLKSTWNNKALTSSIPTKLSDLTSDNTHRLVTDSLKDTWNSKQDAITATNKLSYTLLSDTPTIPTDISQLSDSQGILAKAGMQADWSVLDAASKAYIKNKPTKLSQFTRDINIGSKLGMLLNTTNYILTLTLKDQESNSLDTKTVDFPLLSVVVDGRYDALYKTLILTLKNGNLISIPIGGIISGLVPTTRKINNKQLSADITLTVSDIDSNIAMKSDIKKFKLSIGTVTKGDEAQATVTLSSDSSGGYILSLVLPKGDQGIQGPQGLQGPKGDLGSDGQDGTPAGFGVVDAVSLTLQALEFAYVQVSTSGLDTAKNFHFKFGIPQGPRGLRGLQGLTGLQGPKGDDGSDGQDGVAAGFGNITCSTTTLGSDSLAAVVITPSGPDTAKNFDFKFSIPKGSKGQDGLKLQGNYIDVTSALSGYIVVSDLTMPVAVLINGTRYSLPSNAVIHQGSNYKIPVAYVLVMTNQAAFTGTWRVWKAGGQKGDAGPAGITQVDWDVSDSSATGYIKHKPAIPTALSSLTDDATHRLVTDTEKSTWNNKANSSDIKNSTITLTQGGVTKGSFTLNQSSSATIALDAGGSSVASLTTIAAGGTLQPDGHYTLTMTANTTLNAGGGTAGKIGSALIFISPGAYTFTAGTNLTMVNTLTANKVNHCTLQWYGTACRLYVIDSW